MRSYFACSPLLFAALPLCGQPRNHVVLPRHMPEIISEDDLPRDVMRTGFAHVSVDSDNGHTRVLRFKLAAGESVPTHDDRAGVLICLTGCRLRFTAPDGGVEDLALKAGETRMLPPARRITRNQGADAIEMVYVETRRSST